MAGTKYQIEQQKNIQSKKVHFTRYSSSLLDKRESIEFTESVRPFSRTDNQINSHLSVQVHSKFSSFRILDIISFSPQHLTATLSSCSFKFISVREIRSLPKFSQHCLGICFSTTPISKARPKRKEETKQTSRTSKSH